MNEDLNNFAKQVGKALTDSINNLDGIIKLGNTLIKKESKKLSKQEQDCINYFQPLIMKAALKGNQKEVDKLNKKFAEKLKAIKENADSDK